MIKDNEFNWGDRSIERIKGKNDDELQEFIFSFLDSLVKICDRHEMINTIAMNYTIARLAGAGKDIDSIVDLLLTLASLYPSLSGKVITPGSGEPVAKDEKPKDNTIWFAITDDKGVEHKVIEITPDGSFFWKGERVDDVNGVYKHFTSWLRIARMRQMEDTSRIIQIH